MKILPIANFQYATLLFFSTRYYKKPVIVAMPDNVAEVYIKNIFEPCGKVKIESLGEAHNILPGYAAFTLMKRREYTDDTAVIHPNFIFGLGLPALFELKRTHDENIQKNPLADAQSDLITAETYLDGKLLRIPWEEYIDEEVADKLTRNLNDYLLHFYAAPSLTPKISAFLQELHDEGCLETILEALQQKQSFTNLNSYYELVFTDNPSGEAAAYLLAKKPDYITLSKYTIWIEKEATSLNGVYSAPLDRFLKVAVLNVAEYFRNRKK